MYKIELKKISIWEMKLRGSKDLNSRYHFKISHYYGVKIKIEKNELEKGL